MIKSHKLNYLCLKAAMVGANLIQVSKLFHNLAPSYLIFLVKYLRFGMTNVQNTWLLIKHSDSELMLQVLQIVGIGSTRLIPNSCHCTQ